MLAGYVARKLPHLSKASITSSRCGSSWVDLKIMRIPLTDRLAQRGAVLVEPLGLRCGPSL